MYSSDFFSPKLKDNGIKRKIPIVNPHEVIIDVKPKIIRNDEKGTQQGAWRTWHHHRNSLIH